MSRSANLVVTRDSGGTRKTSSISISTLIVAGWTGRDVAALQKHIRELEEIGVKPPKSTPIFYRAAAGLLTTDDEIEVVGTDTSGEVEFLLLSLDDGLWLTVASDHTDRKVETVGVTVSKQLCFKPVGATLWRFDDVRPHWDRLVLRAYAVIGSDRRLYQEGAVALMRDPVELMDLYCGKGKRLPAGSAMFSGTLAAIGGIRPAASFEMELEDPVLKRKIAHRYRIVTLPIEG
ncbi:MAG: DUF2848 domain-containing protein [Proteobacteria bacterium]|nr:DUF2848 domain-containing protein [Pseudomonadota bacterium]